MAKNIFIFGAGASAHAGVPVMKDFFDEATKLYENDKLEQDDKDIFKFIINAYMTNFKQIAVNFSFDPGLKNIETIFSLIYMAKTTKMFPDSSINIDKLGLSIARFIVRTIEKKTVFHAPQKGSLASPHDYDYFVEKILVGDQKPVFLDKLNCCIITFNYDIALDFVVDFHFGPGLIDYGLDNMGGNNFIKIFKLHGSINWAKCSNQSCGEINAINTKDGTDGRLISPKNIEMSKIILKNRCKKCGSALSESPILVPPTWNKSGNNEIESVWRRAAVELSGAKNIFIIGYSLPKTDLFFKYLLALSTLGIMNLNRIWVFNMDREVDKKFTNFLGRDMKEKYLFNGPDDNHDFKNFVNLLIRNPNILYD